MLAKYLITVLIIAAMLGGWIAVQHLARAFAARHPELGEAREDGLGCGLFCGCLGQNSCPRKKLGDKTHTTVDDSNFARRP